MTGSDAYFYATLYYDSTYSIAETLTVDETSGRCTMFLDSTETNITAGSYIAEIIFDNVSGYRRRINKGKIKIIKGF
jgi:hypothetical protein